MEGVGTIAGTVKIHSPKFAPPAVGSGVVRLTWSGSQTPAAVRKLRVEGSHTRFLRSQTQRPFANFALSFWLRKVRLRQCAGPIVYRPLPFCRQKCVVSFVDMNHKDQTCDFACKGSFSAGMISGDSVIVSSSCFTDRQSLQIVTLPDKRGKAREYQRFPTAAKNFVKGFVQFAQPSRRSRQSGWFGSCKEPLEFLRSKTWICLFAGCCRCVAECCRHDFSWFGNNFFKIDADRKGLKGKSQKNINAFQQPPNPVWILFLKFAEHPRRIIRLHGFNCCSKPKFRAKWRGSVLLQGQ